MLYVTMHLLSNILCYIFTLDNILYYSVVPQHYTQHFYTTFKSYTTFKFYNIT